MSETTTPQTERPQTMAPEPASTELILTGEHHGDLAQRVAAGHPHEVCGLIVGRLDGQRVEALRIVQAGNLNTERAHDRYQLDPEDFLAADKAARADGLDIVGIWHSHPDHPAEPSITDLEAAWEGYSYLIIRVTAEGAQEFRSWRLDEGLFREEKVTVSSH